MFLYCTVSRPQPLSTIAKRSANEKVISRAGFINNVLTKIEEVWLGKGATPQASPAKRWAENTKTGSYCCCLWLLDSFVTFSFLQALGQLMCRAPRPLPWPYLTHSWELLSAWLPNESQGSLIRDPCWVQAKHTRIFVWILKFYILSTSTMWPRLMDLVVQPSCQTPRPLFSPPRPPSSWVSPKSTSKAPELSLLRTPQVVKVSRNNQSQNSTCICKCC